MSEQMDFEDGKYTVIYDEGHFKALRYGQPWRDLTGDNLVYAMLVKAIQLKEERDALAAKLKELEGQEPAAWVGYGPRDGRVEFCINKPAPSVFRDFGFKPLFASPPPAEPVNARLLEALKGMVAIHDEPAGFEGKYGKALAEAIDRQQQKIDGRLLAARSALADADAQQATPSHVVGSWPWLRGVIKGIPIRIEPIGGQQQSYVALDEVLGWIEEGQRRSAEAQQAEPVRLTRESVARAIWGVRREYEDRCDMELEDMQDIHPVWREADAVLAVTELAQSKPALMTIEQAKNAERYAYLRSQHEGSVAASFAVFAPEQPIGEFGPVGSMPGELDAAIDSAMRADSHKVEG